MKRRLIFASAAVLWLITAGLYSGVVGGQTRELQPGDPLPGVTTREFEEFRLGLDDFTEVETAEEGLGPAFNGASCSACHSVPAIGGGGFMLETRAGYKDADGTFRGLNPEGDTLIHLFSVPSHQCQPLIPDDVTVIARRAPIPLFGAGLVEAILDETLLGLEDPFDRDRDGVSGRAAVIVDVATGDRRVGRFGWKAQHATLLAFGADAYRNEMGITNDLFRAESLFGIADAQLRRCDPMPDPEDVRERSTGRRGIDNFESFMRFLAPIARSPSDEQTREGERLFSALGCPSCHIPALTTGPSANPLFHRRPVPLFSDLLLHDVGTGDGIRQGAAEPHEIRTPALWGLRLRRPLLHDGASTTIEDAILRHRNEADLARRGFERLAFEEQRWLIAFLRSL
jgi:CxxC motif-containing protein (DUF1111 family)